MRTKHQRRQHTYWKQQHREAKLEAMYSWQTKAQLMAAFPAVTWKAIVVKAHRMGLSRHMAHFQPFDQPLKGWRKHHKDLHHKYGLCYDKPFSFETFCQHLQEEDASCQI